MENKELIINALQYYDKIYEEKTKLLKKVKYYKSIKSTNDIEHSKLILYDKDKKELYQSRYEMLGAYLPNIDIWVWGWALPSLRKNQIGLIKRMLNYGIDLDDSNLLLRSQLITSRFKIDSNLQLDITLALIAYITKSKTIFKVITKKEEADTEIFPLYDNVDEHAISCHYVALLDI